MYTKDSPVYGGCLNEGMPFVDWKDLSREIPGSRTDHDEDKMAAACAIAELAGGCVSAYRDGSYDENVSSPEAGFSERHRSSDEAERMEFVGRWMESWLRGKEVSRYVHGQYDGMHRLVNAIEADRGRKRKMEEVTGFVLENNTRVVNGRDNFPGYRKTVRISPEVDCHSATVQNGESPNNDPLRGHSSTLTPSDSSNRETGGGRFVRSAMISSYIPGLTEARTELSDAGGHFVRTSLRGKCQFRASDSKRTTGLSPVHWSPNSPGTTNRGPPLALSNDVPPEMLKLHRNAEPALNPESSDLEVGAYNGSLQSCETLKGNGEQSARVKSPPVLSSVSLQTVRSSSSATNNTEVAVCDVAFRSSVIPPRLLFINDATLQSSPAFEFRQVTPSSSNGFSYSVHVTTSPENGLGQSNFLLNSDYGVSNNTAKVSSHEFTKGHPLVQHPRSGSVERKSEERRRSDMEASCERDLLDSSRKTAGGYGATQYNPIPRNHPACYDPDCTLRPGSFHSGSVYGGHNAPNLSPEYFSVATPFERMSIEGKMPQLQRLTPVPTTGTYLSFQNEIYRRTDAPIKDHPYYKTRPLVAGMCSSIRTRETTSSWVARRREHEPKRLHRSKSLSPSMISNLESGNFGSLQSIRAYYKTLGMVSKPSSRFETTTAEEILIGPNNNTLGKTTHSRRLETRTAEEILIGPNNNTLGKTTHSRRLETRTAEEGYIGHNNKSLGRTRPSSRLETRTAVRAYDNTLGKATHCEWLETGPAKEEAARCSDSQRFIESMTGGADMAIDLSSRVRKLERNDLKSPAKVNNAREKDIDCWWRLGAEISGGHLPQSRCTTSPEHGETPLASEGAASHRNGVDVSGSHLLVPSPSTSQPGSRLGSPSSMPDSHLPPKKRRMPNYLSPVSDPCSSRKEVLSASTSPDCDRSPVWDRISVSGEESLEFEARTQLEQKTELTERCVLQSQWQDDGLENLEDVRWAISPDEDGDLPLHIAVARGAESYVRKCVGIMSRLGASLDVYDSNKKTALQIAVITSQLNIVEILLRASASPNILDRSGANSVHLAVKYGELECLKCLLTQSNHVLDLDARDYEGLTALHIAVRSNQLEATRILLRVGASVNVKDGKTGQTPLQYAAESNSQQMAKLLLVFGANPSTASYSGYTPAQLASAKSHLEMAKLLERSAFSLSNGAVTTRGSLHVKEQ